VNNVLFDLFEDSLMDKLFLGNELIDNAFAFKNGGGCIGDVYS